MFQNKKNFRANLKFFIAGVGLGFHISASCVNIPARLHLLTQTSCPLFLPFGRRKFRFKSKQMDLKQKKLQSESEVFYSWGWTWLPYFRVLRQYSSPASLAYADFLSALPPIWSAQVSLQVQTDGFKTKKTSERI